MRDAAVLAAAATGQRRLPRLRVRARPGVPGARPVHRSVFADGSAQARRNVMRISTALVAAMLGVCRLAAAQGDPPPPAEPAPPAEQPAPPPTPTPPPAPAPPPPLLLHDDAAADAGRPEGTAFGIGIGYALPTTQKTTNTASYRKRIANRLTLETR